MPKAPQWDGFQGSPKRLLLKQKTSCERIFTRIVWLRAAQTTDSPCSMFHGKLRILRGEEQGTSKGSSTTTTKNWTGIRRSQLTPDHIIVKLVMSAVHKRAARDSAHKLRQRQESSRIDCPICRITEVNVVTGCGHVFCKGCINHWKAIGNSCPTCRKRLEGPYPLHI